MKLTKNFTLEEFVNSETALKHGIENKPTEKDVYRIQILCEKLLQPLRERIGKPVIINSGFRCKELNQLVGGVSNSQHLKGQAADIHIPGMGLKEAFSILQRKFIYDQAILELNKWIHVSYDLWDNRIEALVAYSDNEKIRYKAYSPPESGKRLA